jgi:peptidyl-prolyl cis-trans isomerase C
VEPESPAVAIVNGQPITQSEVDYRWSLMPDSMRSRYESQGGKKRFVDDLVDREILLQEARRLGLEHSPTVVERFQRLREQVLLDELMKEMVQGRPDVSEDEIRAYVEAHPSATLEAQQVKLSQIVVPTEQQAKDIRRQIEQGYNFERLAQKYSTDEATRAKGGEIGLYRRGAVAPEVEPALLTLKAGAVSDPIATSSGYHLIKVVSRMAPESTESTEAKRRLKQELLAEKGRKQFETAMGRLRASATVWKGNVTGESIESAGMQPPGK